MGFVELPVELVYSYILTSLTWNDLLRLRHVNKRAKLVVDSYIRANDGIPNTVEIKIKKAGFGTFADFVHLGYPASRIYLCNYFQLNEPDILECVYAWKFLEKYGSYITHLKVQQMYTNPSALQLKFYESLKNLRCVEIECLGKYDKYPAIPKILAKRLNFYQWFKDSRIVLPKTFANLKELNMSQTLTAQITVSTTRLTYYNVAILEECSNLTTIKLGYVSAFKTDHICTLVRLNFLSLQNHLWQRSLAPEFSNLKYIDFENYATNFDRLVLTTVSSNFLILCRELKRFQAKVINLPVQLLSAFNPMIHEHDTVSNVVLSMIGISKEVLEMELDILEDLRLKTLLDTSFVGANPPYRVSWPALKNLSVSVMGTKVEWFTEEPALSVVDLFDVLFGNDVQRPTLKYLKLYFHSRMFNTWSKNLATFPYPRGIEIVSSCPNLTTLCITGWPDGNNINFSKLWKGLPKLRKVWLSECKLLSDDGFIGEDESKPSFLELKKIKELFIVGLHKMPLITDKVFATVFRNLNVSKFYLQSDKPLTNITEVGIMSLLNGTFANSIEYFPFSNWSLQNVDQLRFANLRNKFRSSGRM